MTTKHALGTRDLYETLGVARGASPTDLKKAYAQQLHPDKKRFSDLGAWHIKRCHDDYWRAHPDKLKYLLYWYPHWGAEPLVNELDLSIDDIQYKARALKIKLLRRRGERLCYYCRVNFMGNHPKFGQRCTECSKPHRANRRKASINRNPLRQRLLELAYQLYSRNRRKGIQVKISVEALLQLWDRQEGRCAYTGRKMFISDAEGGKRRYDTLSVDRVNSQQGYLNDNIVLCTWWANVAKHELGVSEFVERCREVVQMADSVKQTIKT